MARRTTGGGTGRSARLAGGLLPLVLLAACGAGSSASEPAASTPSVAPSPASPAEEVMVTKVVEGDTLLLADGRRVRVLGLDSCDPDTPGGQAARVQAAEQLSNPASNPVTLTREPGVDRDAAGAMLRYVQLGGADLGQRMVPYDHTGAFSGGPGMSPSPQYLELLRALDTRSSDAEPPVARECGEPGGEGSGASTTTTSPTTTSSSGASDSSDSSDSDGSSSSDDAGSSGDGG